MHHTYQSQGRFDGPASQPTQPRKRVGIVSINNGARVGAAAFVLGLSLAGPHAAVASADGRDSDSSMVSAGPAAGDSSRGQAPGHRNTNRSTRSAAAERPTRSGTEGETPHPNRHSAVKPAAAAPSATPKPSAATGTDDAVTASTQPTPLRIAAPATRGAAGIPRQAVDGQPLIRDLLKDGGNVTVRVVARLVEIARIVLAMESWAKQLKPKEPFCETVEMPPEGAAFGLVEAARGALGHWIKLKHGRILNYQIVAPTTWNFSPRDAAGTPGALEQALVGTPVPPDDPVPVAVQHVVRSFDPCMVCTVH